MAGAGRGWGVEAGSMSEYCGIRGLFTDAGEEDSAVEGEGGGGAKGAIPPIELNPGMMDNALKSTDEYSPRFVWVPVIWVLWEKELTRLTCMDTGAVGTGSGTGSGGGVRYRIS